MDIGSILIILSAIILISLYIGSPIFNRREAGTNLDLVSDAANKKKDHHRSELLAEHDRLLTALQELDFDLSLGKLDEQVYNNQRTALLKAGANVLHQLDEIELPSDIKPVQSQAPAAANCSADKPQPLAVDENDELEALIATRRRARQEKNAGFCHKCGAPLKETDKFCPRCGVMLD